jgi:diacylglycerol kinase (ATP)
MRLARQATKVAVVVNAGSRRGAAVYGDALRLLQEADVPVATARAVGDGDTLADTLDQVLAGDHDLLVVGGGDGTISCAAGRASRSGTPLAVLPLGTANDFARTLQIPSDLDAACRVVSDGRVADVDLGWVDGRPFLNVASVGLSVGVTQALTPGLKRRLGPLAYPVATLRAYRRHRPFTARLQFPADDHEPVTLDDLLQVAVGNGRHYGGGNAVSPTAGIDDHLLDVYAVVRGRMRDHVNIARLLRDGSFVEHEQVHHLTTRAVQLVTDPEQAVNIDGEVEARTPSLFEIERNALHVVVPAGSTAATLERPADRG